jgi:hypothetical protein
MKIRFLKIAQIELDATENRIIGLPDNKKN